MVSLLFTMKPWEIITTWGVSWAHGKIFKLLAPPTPVMRASHGSHDITKRLLSTSWAHGQIFKFKEYITSTMRNSDCEAMRQWSSLSYLHHEILSWPSSWNHMTKRSLIYSSSSAKFKVYPTPTIKYYHGNHIETIRPYSYSSNLSFLFGEKIPILQWGNETHDGLLVLPWEPWYFVLILI